MNRMMKKCLLSGLLALAVTQGAKLASAQKTPAAASGGQPAIATSELTETVLEEIKTIEGKLIAAAEGFPDKLYNTYHLNGKKDLPTAAEIFLEVADFNATSAFEIGTREQQRTWKRPDDRDYVFESKEATVMKIKQSFAAVRKAIQDNPDTKNLQDWLFVISFSCQRYGSVRTYYRINGLEPPSAAIENRK